MTDNDERISQIAYDSEVWQRRDGGDFIHVKTGEIREEDEFDFSDRVLEEDAPPADIWDILQDGGTDESGSQVRRGKRG